MFAPTRDNFFEPLCRRPFTGDIVQALDLVRSAGPLARIWLRPELLAAADAFVGGIPPTVPPAGPGGTRALVLTPGGGRYAALRSAFALPLRWTVGEDHSPRLPPGLAEFATGLVARHAGEFEIPPPAAGRWTLRLGGSLAEGCDLSRLDFKCEWSSATAALLAGLALAALDAEPDPGVLATAAWEGGRLAAVEGIAEKLDAASAAGAHTVFLPAANASAALDWQHSHPDAGLRTIALEPRSSLRLSLAPFFDAIEARPGPEAPLETVREFYESRLRSDEQRPLRRDFYLQVVAPRLAATYAGPRPLAGPCHDVIGVVSPGVPPPLAFLAGVLSPRRALLLHDSKARADALVLAAHLREAYGIEAVSHEFGSLLGPRDELRPAVAAVIRGFLEAGPRREAATGTVIDLTAGVKRLSFLLLEVAPAGSVCVHVDAERVDPMLERIGTERIVTIAEGRAGA